MSKWNKPDNELNPEEKEQYAFLMGNNRFGEAWNFEQACLFRYRLNYLNKATKRVEIATAFLLIATIILIGVALLRP